MRLRENHTIAAWYLVGTDSYDFSYYHLRFGKFSAMLTTTGHTVGSFAVCMLKYRVKTTGTDERHVVSCALVAAQTFQSLTRSRCSTIRFVLKGADTSVQALQGVHVYENKRERAVDPTRRALSILFLGHNGLSYESRYFSIYFNMLM